MTTATFPTTIDALTPSWLTTALREQAGLGDASITAVRAEPIGQGVGILCQLARLHLTYDGVPANAPATLVAKIPTLEQQTRGLVAIFQFYGREVRFYQDLASRVSLAGPRCYYAAHDPTSNDFVLLLEDLGAARLGDQLASCTIADAELAIDELARLHARWWNAPELDALEWVPAADSEVNRAGLMLYPMAWPVWQQRFGGSVSERVVRAGEALGARCGEILARFVDGPRTLCHGDFRLDNLFFATQPGDPALRVIDWQIAIRGVGTYDVGYFITQSLTVEDRRAHEMELLRRYHAALVAGGVGDYSFDDLLEHYRWTALFCFAYPVMGGGLGDLSNERGAALATAMTERSAAAIEDWKADELLA
jgi:hypothetical protein